MSVEKVRFVLLEEDLHGASIVGTGMEGRAIRYRGPRGQVRQVYANDIEGAGYSTVPKTIKLVTDVAQNPNRKPVRDWA